MAEGEPLALLLASMPYRQAELSPEGLDSLRDIGLVAGNILAFGDALVESSLLAKEQTLDEIAAAPSDAAFDFEAIGKIRREMETSLEGVSERLARADLQIIELQQQLQQQHIRLLDAMAEGDNGESAIQRLSASFDEQAQLREIAGWARGSFWTPRRFCGFATTPAAIRWRKSSANICIRNSTCA